ncbi:hypothetical protein Nepgr_028686 [Nepenthes gracilis]|uniref:Uncharacterized protein n=1 Tax=Nepenthes gracilis TaxID=150966 RepID=A0AAD3TCS8_NEPGR|nr:hypothetical protein Nepgr_028686 [Nepenthes gracilis]
MRGVTMSLLMFMISCGMRLLGINGEPQVPCFFIFGDSLSDNGNNNQLNTTAKANYQPYGIDFLDSIPTGRFTNNLTAVDIITKKLGLPWLIPSFANATMGANISSGVNYASGGAGILPETGKNLGQRIPLDQQIKNHVTIIRRPDWNTDEHKCLYSINIGSNDYINNYFLPSNNQTRQLFTPEQFAELLICKFRLQIETLHQLGARKVVLFGLGEIGCTLAEIALYGPSNGSSCVENINSAVMIFNDKLVSLVKEFNVNLTDAKFIYINSTAVQLTPLQGFKVFNASCCMVRADDGLCVAGSRPCDDRSEYVFWDYFHPTYAVNALAAGSAYEAQGSPDAYPTDISHLVKS